MDDWEQQLAQLDPALARRIRDSASRAGLQSHDPAARMITEMWIAVAAQRQEREQISREMADLRRTVRDNNWYLLVLVALTSVSLVLALFQLLS